MSREANRGLRKMQIWATRLEWVLSEGGSDALDQLPEALDQLPAFAERWAADRTLFHRALLLSRRLRAEGGPSEALAREGLELLGDVLADAEASGVSPGQRQERVERAQVEVERVAPPRAVVLAVDGLSKTYRGTDFRLRDVRLELRQGEILGVVGRNSHGKTTLLRILAGELRHDSGELGYPALQNDGAKIDWSKVRHQIAYLPQDLPRWYGSLRNNLHYEAAIHGLRGEENEREVDYIVERLELSGELDKRWSEISGGMKLRFALARALVWKPKLLVLDEPLANLDFVAQQILLQDLRHLTNSLRHPMAVVISSQHLHEVEAVSDRVLYLRHGHMVYEGKRAEIGDQRVDNIFELSANLDLSALRQLLGDLPNLRVHHNGVAFLIRSDRGWKAADLLRRLLDAGLEIEYFRDLSRSAKSLFKQEDPRGGEEDGGSA